MARAKAKPRPMRSRRSGIKKLKQYQQNHEVIKKVEQQIDWDYTPITEEDKGFSLRVK